MGNGVSEEEKQKIYALQSSHQQLQAQHNILQQQLRSCQQLVREKDYQLRTFEDTCNQQKQQIEQSQLQTQRMDKSMNCVEQRDHYKSSRILMKD